MKRRSSQHNSGSVGSSDGEQGFWPSYADMMSSFALILFFLMLISYIQNLITGNTLSDVEEMLAETQTSLIATQNEIDEKENSLSLIQIALAKAEEELKGKQDEITDQQAKLSEQQKMLAAQQDRITSQEEYLTAANEELYEMRGQMQTIAVLRLSILEQIKDSIVGATGDSSKVSIGENGNIILNEGVFFDTGSSDIKEESVSILNKLINVFGIFLSNSENSQYIDSIVISGHTDADGTDESNRILSTNRANSVLNYLMAGNNGILSRYSQYFCAAGYGESRPVASNDTPQGKAQNRRIEISIILKDDTVLDIVDQYLNIDPPEEIAAESTANANAA